MNDWIDEWTTEWMDERLNEWITGWMSVQLDERMNDWMNEQLNEWMTEWINTTRIKKKTHLFIFRQSWQRKLSKIFFVQAILKIFKFSFNLNQSQVCISNRLKVKAFQSQPLFWAYDKYSIIEKNVCHFYIQL